MLPSCCEACAFELLREAGARSDSTPPSLQLGFQKVLSPKKGFSVSDQTFLASGVPREEGRRRGSQYCSHASIFVSLFVSKFIPWNVGNVTPLSSSGTWERKSGRARIHTYMAPSFFDSDWIRNSLSRMHCLRSSPMRSLSLHSLSSISCRCQREINGLGPGVAEDLIMEWRRDKGFGRCHACIYVLYILCLPS